MSMTYEQIIAPNLDPYIYVNGAPLSDWLGWCMGYVSSAFQIFGAASAHIGWTKAQNPHTDKDLPSGVYVPIWFDWYGDIDGTGVKNWGHVAIYKDGLVWSSPLSHKPSADVYQSFNSFVTAFKSSGVDINYVGWSEDLLGTEVIKQGEDMSVYDIVPPADDIQTHYQKRMFRDATPAELANVMKLTWGHILDDNVTELGARLKAAEQAMGDGKVLASGKYIVK